MYCCCARVSPALLLLLVFAAAAAAGEKNRIFVDQWSPTRSVLYIAGADGSDPRKLLAGSHRDYNASFSHDGEWVVFTSERFGSADIFRVRTDGLGLERLTDHPRSTIRRRCRPTAPGWRSSPRAKAAQRTFTSSTWRPARCAT